MAAEKLVCAPENVARFREWIANRGGLALWSSANLSNPGASWTTPADVVTKPTWQAQDRPSRIITDVDDVVVSVDKEVKRFHVGVRAGAQGLTFKVTDGGSRRIRAAVAKAGEGAYYEFDYMTQEAVIMAPERQVPLREWKPC